MFIQKEMKRAALVMVITFCSMFCRVLNSAVCPDLTSDSDEDEIKLSLQLNVIREIYEKYKSIPIFESISLESLQNGYTEFVRYAYRYFDIDNVKPADLWHKLCRSGKEREDWKPIMLLIELCRCTQFVFQSL